MDLVSWYESTVDPVSWYESTVDPVSWYEPTVDPVSWYEPTVDPVSWYESTVDPVSWYESTVDPVSWYESTVDPVSWYESTVDPVSWYESGGPGVIVDIFHSLDKLITSISRYFLCRFADAAVSNHLPFRHIFLCFSHTMSDHVWAWEYNRSTVCQTRFTR